VGNENDGDSVPDGHGASIKLAIGALLCVVPTEPPPMPIFHSYVFDKDGRSKPKLDSTAVAITAELALSTHLPSIMITYMEAQMTPAGAVVAISMRYKVIETGRFDWVRVEIPE
jgi:hypothetical protein